MSKSEFMKKLKKKLSNYNIEDIDDIIQYYEDIIDGKLERGESIEAILSKYSNIDLLVSEIVKENNSSKLFTFKDYISESMVSNTELKNIVTPVSSGSMFENNINVRDDYNLNLSIWSRDVNIESGDIEKTKIQYKKRFLYPLNVYYENNNINIVERGNRIWILVVIQILTYLALALGLYFGFKNIITNKPLFYTTVFVGSGIIHSLIFILLNHVNKKSKVLNVVLPKNTKLNNLKLVIRTSNANLSNIVGTDLIVKMLSGKINLVNYYFNDMHIKVSSGSGSIGDEGINAVKTINSLNLIVNSGSIKVYNTLMGEFNTRISSGSIKLYDCKMDKNNVRINSGSCHYFNTDVSEYSNIKLSSGSFRASNILLNKINLNIKSGSAKLTNIQGSEKDFLITTNVRSGSIRVNGNNRNILTNKIDAFNINKEINANVFSGSIKLDFSEK